MLYQRNIHFCLKCMTKVILISIYAVTKQSYSTVTWGRHIYIKTIENIPLKSPSLCSETFHTFRCVGEGKGLCVRVCVSENPWGWI